MQLFYLSGIFLYAFAVRLLAPFHAKARLFRRGRKHLFRQLHAAVAGHSSIIWFHCASLGEFEQGRPLIEACRRMHPHHKILLTFFSPSGYEVRKHYPGADWVCYLPLDTPRNARRFVQTVQPAAAVFVKYDFWYYFLKNLQRQHVPTYVVSAVFRPSQAFFKWYGGFFRRMLRAYTCLFVQNDESAALLRHIGITRTVVAGDTRFDRVRELAQNPKPLPLLQSFCTPQPTLVAGSTWPPDEEKLAAALAALPAAKLVIAPHEIHEEHLRDIERLFAAFRPVRYSTIAESGEGRGERDDTRVLLIDTIGLLSSAYRYGTVAYIGGGFGAGIHNTLEAAVYGIPVVFGTNYHRFREACDLLAAGGASTFRTAGELTNILTRLLSDTLARQTAGQTNRHYVESHCGAAGKILLELRTKS